MPEFELATSSPFYFTVVERLTWFFFTAKIPLSDWTISPTGPLISSKKPQQTYEGKV
jgi:hypothetical protein